MKQIVDGVIDGKRYFIHPPVGNSGTYKVTQDKFLLGWISNFEINEFTGERIWTGTTVELKELAKRLGEMIDSH